MSNFPGIFGSLPAVWGPISYPIRKMGDNEYYIKGYSATEFKGSPRDIAKQIILDLCQKPEGGIRKNYVGPFWLDFESQYPKIRCVFVQDAAPEPEDLNLQILSESISEELTSLKHLIIFS